jgi:HSP20 family protein
MDVLKGRIRREFAALEEQLDQVFERAFGSGLRLPTRTDSYRPPIDVYETDEAIVVQVELSGVAPGDIRLVVDGEYLQISGRREMPNDPAPQRHLRMEISQGPFERVLRLPEPYDPDGVVASLDAGLLRVTLPKRPRVVQQIPVKSE